ncbi:MAG: hypothetical protein JST44_01125 [Cyanobacteria bacterium SZAS LIN-5]|nr:hypothetical protein [Cyanobacteria bacterium SZAS LIN-5]
MAGERLIAKVGLAALTRAEEVLPAVEGASKRGLNLLDVVAEGTTEIGKTVAKAVGNDI